MLQLRCNNCEKATMLLLLLHVVLLLLHRCPEKGTGKVDKTPATGTNASMAIVAGLVVLAGAAFVASKKSK